MAKKDDNEQIIILKPEIEQVIIPVEGERPLIVHQWSKKARNMMLAKQMGIIQGPREKKDPEEDFNSSRYISDDGWDGVPSVSFKAALVGACRQIKGISMVLAKRIFFIVPDGKSVSPIEDLVTGEPTDMIQTVELTRIYGEPTKRMDMVRLETGVADIRFRAEYSPWRANIHIQFNSKLITADHLYNLVMLAGQTEGIGEWRPSSPNSSTGSFGIWKVT